MMPEAFLLYFKFQLSHKRVINVNHKALHKITLHKNSYLGDKTISKNRGITPVCFICLHIDSHKYIKGHMIYDLSRPSKP